MKVIMTYDNEINELEKYIGFEFEVLNETADSFFIMIDSEIKELSKEHFTAYMRYKGERCIISLFNMDNTCIIITKDGKEQEVRREEIQSL